jgi:phosphoenolpyruvate-protein phosphotransferase (PTS system enzyme I)
MSKQEEIRLRGVSVSDGIAIGVPFFLISSHDEILPEFPITVGEVDHEIARYRRALFSSREDLQQLQSNLVSEGSQDAMSIIDTHIQMLEDPLMTTHIEEKIRQMQQNTESVFRSAILEYEKQFLKKDAFFQQRMIDVMDLSRRVLGHLHQKKKVSLTEIPFHAIIFAMEILPSDIAAVQPSRIQAFVTHMGGGNSHAALIARAKGIPYISCIDVRALHMTPIKQVIVDGGTGEVILNPAKATLQEYEERQSRQVVHDAFLSQEGKMPAHTLEGYPIKVLANIGNLSDLDLLSMQNVDGIGLFRTEYLFLQSDHFLCSEEEQYEAYREVLHRASGQPVVIRVFDIGGDKYPELFREFHREQNPVLGCRGIRFLLKRKEIFKTQLRALLRASVHGNMRLLLPLISDIHELLESKRLIRMVQDELDAKKVAIGCMIEVPSAVLMCDLLLEHCDFLSIGTNDLFQYTLGVDRGQASVQEALGMMHPSMVRMIKMIALAAKMSRKPVALCGEAASNPLLIPLLIGLGVEEFSCAPRYIPLVKYAIRQSSLLDCYALAEKALLCSTGADISKLLQKG